MGKGPERPRRLRRELDRAARKDVRKTQRLGTSLPGGTESDPIDVSSAAVVEVQARGTPCLHCGGELTVQSDAASSTPRGVLRALVLQCRRCHAPRHLWFRITPPHAN